MPPNKEASFTPGKDLYNFLGLDYNPPKGSIECFKEFFGVVPFLRNGINSLINTKDAKR